MKGEDRREESVRARGRSDFPCCKTEILRGCDRHTTGTPDLLLAANSLGAGKGTQVREQQGRAQRLTIDLRIRDRRLLALFSANSRLLMSLRRALYLFICSMTISSTQLRVTKRQNWCQNEFYLSCPCLAQRSALLESSSVQGWKNPRKFPKKGSKGLWMDQGTWTRGIKDPQGLKQRNSCPGKGEMGQGEEDANL